MKREQLITDSEKNCQKKRKTIIDWPVEIWWMIIRKVIVLQLMMKYEVGDASLFVTFYQGKQIDSEIFVRPKDTRDDEYYRKYIVMRSLFQSRHWTPVINEEDTNVNFGVECILKQLEGFNKKFGNWVCDSYDWVTHIYSIRPQILCPKNEYFSYFED